MGIDNIGLVGVSNNFSPNSVDSSEEIDIENSCHASYQSEVPNSEPGYFSNIEEAVNNLVGILNVQNNKDEASFIDSFLDYLEKGVIDIESDDKDYIKFVMQMHDQGKINIQMNMEQVNEALNEVMKANISGHLETAAAHQTDFNNNFAQVDSGLAEMGLSPEELNIAMAFNGQELVSVTDFLSPDDPSVVGLYQQLINDGVITSSMTDEEKLTAINTYVNKNFNYEKDQPGEGWSTAAQTIASGSGDCEDLAILVANLALAAGIDENKVQVCVQGGTIDNQGHVVVGLENDSGKLTTFDAVNGNKSEAEKSQFTFVFNSLVVESGTGDTGNSWMVEDINDINSLWTSASGSTSSYKDVRSSVATTINEKYQKMLDMAVGLDDDLKPGDLFLLQQDLQLLKDQIATLTALGKMLGDVLSEAAANFQRALNS